MKKLKSNFILKFTSVILFGVFVALTLLSAASLLFGMEYGAFGSEQKVKTAKEELFNTDISGVIYIIWDYVGWNYVPLQGLEYADMSENLMYEIKSADGDIIFSNIDDSETRASYSKTLKTHYYYSGEYAENEELLQFDEIEIIVCLKKNFTEKDGFYYIDKYFDFVAKNGETRFIATASVTAILSIVLFIYLMCSSGHKSGENGIHVSRFDRFPFDLLVGIFGLAILGLAASVVWIMEAVLWNFARFAVYYSSYSVVLPLSFAYCVFAVILSAVLITILCITAAVRLKSKTFVKTTLIYKLLRLCKKFFLFVARLLSKMPLVWKAVLISMGIFVVEFILLITEEPILILLYNLILAVCLILVAVLLKTIQKGTEDVARGNIYKKINTKYMFGDIKKHAENINHINDGIAYAVEQKMKSERFKTELITNVSHDIKTPLTSIINYVDLLGKEDIDNETATGYVEVLSRQSARLKKLIDDLLEASKASTGNLTVNLSKFELGILLSQAIGEYEERFENSELEIVLNKPEELLFIMADSRHMWRVFDNVFNNIAKYAQPHTRVYIDVTHKGKIAEIYFRNISKDQLNISGEELMERFVRGDSSRNTEGSGLGLSIAKSLVELQKGSFEIQIDGDLFKVRLAFPLCD